jgi:N-acetyl-gamma-glutamyl-phosphate reductase/acetylglutamate kinase
MFRRLPSVARVAVPRPVVRSTPVARSLSSTPASNVVLNLDARKTAQEIRSRGITSSALGGREGGMDRDTIIRLLYSLGSRHEVERYLRIFSQSSKSTGKEGVLPEAKFAVLK